MRVLVVHAGETGGTEGLAHMITDALADRGLEVHLYPAAAVRNLVGFDAVVVAGAPIEPPAAMADLTAEVLARADAGERLKEAVAAVAEATGVAKRELYAAALAARGR